MPRLEQRMRQLLQQHPTEKSDVFWALHWYRLLDHSPQAMEHLWAYLQEPCYRAADQVTRRFPMVQYSVADSFQIAIVHSPRILRGYNPDYGSKLKAYAHTAFGNYIRDQLRQQQEIHISSDWGLLRRLSQTQLNEALLAVGFIHTAPLLLLWQCFRAVCTPTPGRSARGLSDPSDDQLHAIARRFQQLSHQLPPNPKGDEDHSLASDPQQLKQELIQLATIARNYLNPSITSLNQRQYDDSTEEPINTIAAGETPMAQLVGNETYAEQQKQIQQINTILTAAIKTLSAAQQTLLTLYYQEKLTQSTIAQKTNIQQYKVSRQLQRIRQKLLLSVVNWGQTTVHISPECDVLENVSDVIHEWLQHHYAPEPSEDSK